MKKIAIIAAIILTTGLTALALTNKENKTTDAKVKIENSNLAGKTNSTGDSMALATAD